MELLTTIPQSLSAWALFECDENNNQRRETDRMADKQVCIIAALSHISALATVLKTSQLIN